MANRPPTEWELVAAVKALLESDADLVAWYAATVDHGLKVLEHDAAVTPVRLQVGVDISAVQPERSGNSCKKYVTILDLYVFETGSNTATANEALGRLETAIAGKDSFVDAKVTAWGRVALRFISFRGRLGQTPEGDGWTVASTFNALSYYF